MEPFQNIQAVTFDVGGTLLEPWPSVGHVYAEVAQRHGWRGVDAAKVAAQFAAAWRARRGFDYSRAAWSDLVTKTFRPWLPAGERVSFFDELYERFAAPDVWRVQEDVLPAIEFLIGREIELGLISNWDERLRPLLQRLKLDRYFRVIIISHEIGFQKPSPVIFHEALRKFTCPAGTVLHIGDNAVEDLEGARGAGFQALLLNRQLPAPGPTALRRLTDLPRFLP